MRAYKKIRTGEYKIDQVQENISQFVAQFSTNPLLNGILHKEKTINTTLALEHKLGRIPLGYLIIKKNSNSVIWNGSITSTLLNLESSASVVVDIWVF
jgi:hypothetical protein